MRVLVATDAWHPQVNGVVRTLEALARSARSLGVDIQFLSPQGFRSVPMPTYPSLRLAMPSARAIAARIEEIGPDSIHIATEGPIGLMTRAYCRKRGLRFTTSYTTRFPEYISARFAIPESWSYAALRRFHAAAAVTMVSTPSLAAQLTERGFRNLAMWGRGVDTDAFTPEAPADLGLPRPIFLCHGRIAIEKNLEAFLSLDLPGSKVVVGEGPQEAELRQRFPSAHFLGLKVGKELASHIAGGGRLCLSEPDRHVRHRAARGARLRRSRRGVPGDRSARRHRRPSRRSARRRPAPGVPECTRAFAKGLPRPCADVLMGEQRPAIHRKPAAASCPAIGRPSKPCPPWQRPSVSRSPFTRFHSNEEPACKRTWPISTRVGCANLQSMGACLRHGLRAGVREGSQGRDRRR